MSESEAPVTAKNDEETPVENAAFQAAETDEGETDFGTEEVKLDDKTTDEVEAVEEAVVEGEFGLCSCSGLWCTWCCRGIWCFPCTWHKIGKVLEVRSCLRIVIPFILFILVLLGGAVGTFFMLADEWIDETDWEAPADITDIGLYAAIAGFSVAVILAVWSIANLICMREKFESEHYNKRACLGNCCRGFFCLPCTAGEIGATFEQKKLMDGGIC